MAGAVTLLGLSMLAVTACESASPQPRHTTPAPIGSPLKPFVSSTPRQQSPADNDTPGDHEPNQTPLQETPASVKHGSALVLLGNETITLDQGTHIYDRICVQDDARINVRGPVTLVLATNQTTVIGGRGIGPVGQNRGTIRIETQVSPEIFVLCDNREAPIDLLFDAQKSTVSVGITGKAGLNISGRMFTIHSYPGWGLPAQFPACDRQMDREPEPSFPSSVHIAQNCVGNYHPGGEKGQKKRLEAEGHKVIAKGKKVVVQDYEKRLVKIDAIKR